MTGSHPDHPVPTTSFPTRRSSDLPAGELCVNLHGLVLFELCGERALDAARVIDNMLEHGFLCVLEYVLKVAGQLLLLEQLLRIEGIDADALIFDAIEIGRAHV